MENLPDEVLLDIFIRLLAKQLARMRCVCKSWNTLLSDSSFVKSHLHRSIHNNDKILWFFHWNCFSKGFFFTPRSSRSPHRKLTNRIKLPINPQSNTSYISVGGSVNGLICFYYSSKPSFLDDYVVGIWNPSISAVLTLPQSLLQRDVLRSFNLRSIHFRFGYDPKTDDYKVVKLATLFRMVPQVEVYSMRNGCWELISQTFPSHVTLILDDDKVCVDGHGGHLHWLGYTDKELKVKTIVAFDLGSKTFREIPFPHSVPDYTLWHSLGLLAGKLCVMARVRDGGCELWVMDQYGVAESWYRHDAFPLFNRFITPYGFTSHSEFLFEVDNKKFGLYDPVAAKTERFKIMGRPFGMTKVVEYVDSLVWVAPAERLQHL